MPAIPRESIPHMTISVQEALSPDHFSELIAESALNPDVVKDRGYRTLYGSQSDREELSGLGFKPAQYNRDEAYPALLIPLYRATGEVIAHQLKPAAPRMLAGAEGKPRAVKYENPAGGTAHIDVPPFTQERLSDTNIGLWITEGIKKVDSLVSQGRAAIGITGVFNWRRKLGTLGGWEDIPLKGRAVTVCFDADTSQNRNVQLAMRRFGAWLESKGARPVFYLIVPSEVDGAEVKGVDEGGFSVVSASVRDDHLIIGRHVPGGRLSDPVLIPLTDICGQCLKGLVPHGVNGFRIIFRVAAFGHELVRVGRMQCARSQVHVPVFDA